MSSKDDNLKVGLEIELGVELHDNVVDEVNAQGWCYGDDSSIRTDLSPIEIKTSGTGRPATPEEIKSIAAEFEQIVSAAGDIDINESMGLHIHVSHPLLHLIYEKPFFNLFIRKYKAMMRGHERGLKRLRNTYCGAFYVDGHAGSGTTRYSAINFLPAYLKWKTVEFRVFPSTKKPDKVEQYLNFTVDLVSLWIQQQQIIKPYRTIAVLDDDSELQDEKIEIEEEV